MEIDFFRLADKVGGEYAIHQKSRRVYTRILMSTPNLLQHDVNRKNVQLSFNTRVTDA